MAVAITLSNPPTVRQPTGYTHAIEIQDAERRLIISGQVGMAHDWTSHRGRSLTSRLNWFHDGAIADVSRTCWKYVPISKWFALK